MRPLVVLAAALLVACASSNAPSTTGTPLPLRPAKPSPTSTPQPDATAPPASASNSTVVAQGAVYDATGKAIDAGVLVEVKTAGRGTPYDSTVPVARGHYAAIGVPVRTGLTFSVLRDGRAVVSRDVPAAVDGSKDLTVNFGGPASLEDPNAAKFPVPLVKATFTPASPATGG